MEHVQWCDLSRWYVVIQKETHHLLIVCTSSTCMCHLPTSGEVSEVAAATNATPTTSPSLSPAPAPSAASAGLTSLICLHMAKASVRERERERKKGSESESRNPPSTLPQGEPLVVKRTKQSQTTLQFSDNTSHYSGHPLEWEGELSFTDSVCKLDPFKIVDVSHFLAMHLKRSQSDKQSFLSIVMKDTVTPIHFLIIWSGREWRIPPCRVRLWHLSVMSQGAIWNKPLREEHRSLSVILHGFVEKGVSFGVILDQVRCADPVACACTGDSRSGCDYHLHATIAWGALSPFISWTHWNRDLYDCNWEPPPRAGNSLRVLTHFLHKEALRFKGAISIASDLILWIPSANHALSEILQGATFGPLHVVPPGQELKLVLCMLWLFAQLSTLCGLIVSSIICLACLKWCLCVMSVVGMSWPTAGHKALGFLNLSDAHCFFLGAVWGWSHSSVPRSPEMSLQECRAAHPIHPTLSITIFFCFFFSVLFCGSTNLSFVIFSALFLWDLLFRLF